MAYDPTTRFWLELRRNGPRPRTDGPFCRLPVRGRSRADLFLLVFALFLGHPSTLNAEPVDGFLIPFETVEVATGETGIIEEVLVREGDVVKKGQPLVRLQDDIQHSLMAIAEAAMNSTGRRAGAQAELRMRQGRLDKLQELLVRGSARHEEVNRAQADLEIAAARVRTIEEELDIKRLEREQARLKWERRTIRSPLNGVVLKIQRKSGEFVGPRDSRLLTVVQLDPLLGVFAVPSESARRIRVGQQVRIRLTKSSKVTAATVERVAPVIDGKSGTVRVELQVTNTQGHLYSGEPCELLLAPNGAPVDDRGVSRENPGSAVWTNR